MKKYFITILLLLSGVLIAQDRNPNVELPDFVIFGKDAISVRKVDKIQPDYISVISDEFLKPVHKPDYLELVEISNPVESDLSLLDSADYSNGFLELKAGRYQLPSGELNYAFPFSGGLLHGLVKGGNQIDYVDNSDKQYLEGSLGFSYYLPVNSDVLPGTKFSINGNHSKNYFNFFGSTDPERKRILNVGNAEAGIQNLYLKEFIFDLNAGGLFTYLDDEKLNEALYFMNGFGRLKLRTFSLGVKAGYQNQNLKTDSLSDVRAEAYFFRPTVSLELFRKIMLEAGFTFSGSESEKLNGLYVSAGAELSRNIVLLAEYSPQGEYLTTGKFLRNNQYYNQQNLAGVFLKKKNKIKATLKYEFDKYYQIDGGIEFYDADNLPYYNNADSSGFFGVLTTDATSWEVFLNLLYHLGPYGYFYGGVNYRSIEDPDSKKIPYYPGLTASLNYGYNFTPALKGEVMFSYLSDRYADIENTDGRKLQSIFNLGFKVTYSVRNYFGVFFELNNLLNTERYIWEGYKEKPIDASVGINYFFN
jgi:hypothetical protein